ncbi:MAG: NAD(P)/FAD-dependent oxidoreductase, partial [Spirochaetota bacterium]
MSECYDVIIIGAGPAGSIAAYEAASRGLGSVLLVEKEKASRCKPCAGGLSPKTENILKDYHFWKEIEGSAYPIHNARIEIPDGKRRSKSFVLSNVRSAYVVNRARFDEILVNAAVGAGAQLKENTKVEELLFNKSRAIGIRTAGGEAAFGKFIIVAAGALNRFHRDFRKKLYFTACIGWFKNVQFTPNTLEIIFEKELKPQYGWLFPESPDCVNIGLCIELKRLKGKKLTDIFAAFLSRQFGSRLSNACQAGRLLYHPIISCTRIAHYAIPGTLLAGEADRLVNCFTGEGIAYALESGILAVRTIEEGIKKDLGDQALSNLYLQRLRHKLEASLVKGGLFKTMGNI